MVKRELYVSYGFSAVRRQQQRQQEVLSSSCPKYFHVIHLPFPVEKKKKTLLQISERPSLLVVRLLTSTLQVYLYIFTLQNYIYIYKTISEMSAPTTIPALDEASKVRTILQKS